MNSEATGPTAQVDALVLLPCPFCGGDNLKIVQDRIRCRNMACDASGPPALTVLDDRISADKWNRRPDVYPIFDVLPRLWAAGYKTKEQDGEWWLFRSDGEGICSGRDFRGLCVNIILAGI